MRVNVGKNVGRHMNNINTKGNPSPHDKRHLTKDASLDQLLLDLQESKSLSLISSIMSS